ncbi:phosphate ABC transporter, permease protein PstA [Desulfuribacillus stibiiarsenatis]|uniref:Phosphate transport system permease protein PstA n=2 Tax=Desulfuribacillus stibiiarsenatis TaxID=1390249 RepID=A0A1E5L341_9FIRM|nr:phosphate ABC transporter, permease protein PstA [Desulfuribacillus stibiiarsenatis]
MKSLIVRRTYYDRMWQGLFLLSTSVGVIALILLVSEIWSEGSGWLTWDFFNNFASRFPEKSGIKAALWGTLWMIGFTIPIAFIIGVSTAFYLEEYAKKNVITRFIQINITNLAGVPSIVFGILGLTLFVRAMDLGRSILAGSFTMALLVLPIVIVASQEAIRAVPADLRHASYAVGGTKWQTIRRILFPAAFPGILTGIILATSRAIGETAPLIMIGALTFVAFTPTSAMDSFTVMPIQIFNWISRPQADFQHVAAAGIIVLLVMLVSLNSLAIYLRNKLSTKR